MQPVDNDSPRHRTDPTSPLDLPAFATTDSVNVLVESPRGSNIKFVYRPERNRIVAERALGLGVTYPYDWGFICGTRGEDGDPIDAMVIDDVTTYPGILIECRPIGLLELTQVVEGRKELNARVFVVPVWNEVTPQTLDDATKAQLERFFLSAVQRTNKQVSLQGWGTAEDAVKHIRAHATSASDRQ